MTIDFKIDDCYKNPPIKIWYGEEVWCPIHRVETETLLEAWTKYLDILSGLSKDKQIKFLYRAVKDDVIVKRLEESYSEEELVQLTKLKNKRDIFKIDPEEWL